MAGQLPTNQQYHPVNTIAATMKTATMTTGAGALIAGVQNTLSKSNMGAAGVFTRFGSTISMFAVVGGVYEFSKCASANLREKDDTWNHAIAGFLAGSAGGLFTRRLPMVLGYGAGLAVAQSVWNFTGSSMTAGSRKDPNVDEVDRKETLRRNRRRDINETISELGEGRGIYGPNYEDRRRERLSEKYGYDFTGVPRAH